MLGTRIDVKKSECGLNWQILFSCCPELLSCRFAELNRRMADDWVMVQITLILATQFSNDSEVDKTKGVIGK